MKTVPLLYIKAQYIAGVYLILFNKPPTPLEELDADELPLVEPSVEMSRLSLMSAPAEPPSESLLSA